METPKKKLDFAKPPVEEVVLSVLFEPLNGLLAPHLGEIWQKFKPDGFVHIAEQPPIPHAVEAFPNPIQQAEFRIGNVPDLARVWFLHKDGSHIIQVQRDRFTFNWRKTESDPKYPGFPTIFERFEEFCNRFGEVINTLGIGEVAPLQYELTYIDQFFHEDGWNTLDDMGKIYNLFVDSQQSDSFWSGADFVNLQMSFPVASLRGRLHLAISNRVKLPEQRQTLQTDFTVRGFPENTESEMLTWFKSAREQILEKFAGTFTEDIQTRVWGRKS